MLLHIFWELWIFISGFFDHKKLKRTVYSKYTSCVTVYTTIQKFGVSIFGNTLQ